MANSQNTFETRVGRFQDMLAILKNLPDYKPTNAMISVESLSELLKDVLNKNNEVIAADLALKAKRDTRRTLAFKDSATNPTCIQACLDNITNYVAGEFGITHPAYKKIYAIKKKINPTYIKRKEIKEEEMPKTTRSSSEKSFTGLVGTAKQIVQIITSLGTSYAPQNSDIHVDVFAKKVVELDNLNQEIALALQQYSDIVQKRKDLYEGKEGMQLRIGMIRHYMASFSGGKKNPQYLQIIASLKG